MEHHITHKIETPSEANMRASERNGVGHESQTYAISAGEDGEASPILGTAATRTCTKYYQILPNYKPSKRMAVTCFDHWKFIILEDFWDDSDPNLT